MIWISIILGLIEAVPAVITIIKDIIDLIHKHHPVQAAQHEHTLLGILLDWQRHRDSDKVQADLSGFHTVLKASIP